MNDLEWPFYVKFCFFQVQNVYIYLYGQRHDIYGEGIDNILVKVTRIRAVRLYTAIKYSKT